MRLWSGLQSPVCHGDAGCAALIRPTAPVIAGRRGASATMASPQRPSGRHGTVPDGRSGALAAMGRMRLRLIRPPVIVGRRGAPAALASPQRPSARYGTVPDCRSGAPAALGLASPQRPSARYGTVPDGRSGALAAMGRMRLRFIRPPVIVGRRGASAALALPQRPSARYGTVPDCRSGALAAMGRMRLWLIRPKGVWSVSAGCGIAYPVCGARLRPGSGCAVLALRGRT